MTDVKGEEDSTKAVAEEPQSILWDLPNVESALSEEEEKKTILIGEKRFRKRREGKSQSLKRVNTVIPNQKKKKEFFLKRPLFIGKEKGANIVLGSKVIKILTIN